MDSAGDFYSQGCGFESYRGHHFLRFPHKNNGITGDYILSLEGLCSLGNNDTAQRLTVTCKTGDREYKKHFLGLSDNVTFFAEQLDAANVSTYHYRVVFKPQSILPDIDFQGDSKELLTNRN